MTPSTSPARQMRPRTNDAMKADRSVIITLGKDGWPNRAAYDVISAENSTHNVVFRKLNMGLSESTHSLTHDPPGRLRWRQTPGRLECSHWRLYWVRPNTRPLSFAMVIRWTWRLRSQSAALRWRRIGLQYFNIFVADLNIVSSHSNVRRRQWFVGLHLQTR